MAGRGSGIAPGKERPPRRERTRLTKRQPAPPRHRRLARILFAIAALAVVAAAVGGWLTYRAFELKREMTAASLLVPEFKDRLFSKDGSAAESTLEQLQSHIVAAQSAANDPLWKTAADIPWIGPNFSAVSELALSAGDVLTGTAKPMLQLVRSAAWESFTPVDGKFDIAPLAAASPTIVSAANIVDLTHSRLSAIDRSELFPNVSEPLDKSVEALNELRTALDIAAVSSKLLPGMLGDGGPRDYLIIVQNNAEIRATGGLPGALAILRVDNGTIQLKAQTSGSAFGKFTPPVDVDPVQGRIYTEKLGSYISDVNLTPDFPTVAQTAKAMWERKFGSHIDGVVAIDPVVLAHVLETLGPVAVPIPPGAKSPSGIPTNLTSENVVQTLLSDVYKNLDDNRSQDAYFASASEQIFKALASGKVPGPKLVASLTRSAAENRLHVWSDKITEQDILTTLSIGGSVSGPSVDGAAFGVFFNDGTGAKMDYYVKRSVQLVEECTGDEYGQVRVRVTSTNTAPANAAELLPASVTGGGSFGVPAGTVQTNVIVYGPSQANVKVAYVNGKRTDFAAYRHANRPIGTVTIALAPGQSSTVELIFGKIVQHTELKVVVTPTVQPVDDVISATKTALCGVEK